jgi:hypothetical protein
MKLHHLLDAAGYALMLVLPATHVSNPAPKPALTRYLATCAIPATPQAVRVCIYQQTPLH